MRENLVEEPLNTQTLARALKAYEDRPYEIRVRIFNEQTNKYEWHNIVRIDDDEGRLFLMVEE